MTVILIFYKYVIPLGFINEEDNSIGFKQQIQILKKIKTTKEYPEGITYL